MQPLSHTIDGLDDAIARGTQDRLVEMLHRVTDLFVGEAEILSEEQIDLFDVVIARLAAAIENRARIELAERLAEIARAPRGVLRTLAHDEIGVARPVLIRSEGLSDDDLVAVALAKGRDHMLAISQRAVLTEPVTDVLVSRGDRTVVHAVAGNTGARFSEVSLASLVDRSRADEPLRALLEERGDLPETFLRQLLAIAKETVRRRLAASLPDALRPAIPGALDRSAIRIRATVLPGCRDYSAALETMEALAAERPLTEADLTDFAKRGQTEETVVAVARMAGLSLTSAERLFDGGEAELLLVVGQSQGWSWPTLKVLFALRDGATLSPANAARLRESFERLVPATAQRILQFIKSREEREMQAAERAAERRQERGTS